MILRGAINREAYINHIRPFIGNELIKNRGLGKAMHHPPSLGGELCIVHCYDFSFRAAVGKVYLNFISLGHLLHRG